MYKREMEALHEKLDKLIHMREIEALNEKLNKLELLQKKRAHFVYEDKRFQGGYMNGFNSYRQQQPHSKPFVPYNQSQGFVPMQQLQGGYQEQQFQGSYQEQQYAPLGFAQLQPAPTPPVPDLTALIQQLLHSQNNGALVLEKHLVEMNTKMDSYTNLQQQIETLSSKLRTLEGQVASTSTPQPISQLPREAIQHSNEYAHAITLRSGRELQSPQGHTLVTEDSGIQEGEVLRVRSRQEIELDFFARLVERAHDLSNPIPILPPYIPELPFLGRIAQIEERIFKKHKMMFIKELEEKIPLVDTHKEVMIERPQEV